MRLADLFPLFDRVARGESVIVSSPLLLAPCSLLPATGTQAEANEYDGRGRLGIYSSGTTGKPKLVWKEWEALRAEVRTGTPNSIWASPFLPWTFAGVQVALQAWGQGAPVLSLTANWEEDWRMLTTRRAVIRSLSPSPLRSGDPGRGEEVPSPRPSPLDGRGEGEGGRERERERDQERADVAIAEAQLKRLRLDPDLSMGAVDGEGARADDCSLLRNPCSSVCLSCTPTYLDLLIQNEPAGCADCHPQQITLGGEVLRPAAGRRFAIRFPRTRFTVIYASAEHGVLLKTHRLDGWYDLETLARRYSEWRIQDGILELHRGGKWLSTGDLVEQRNELLRVIGRADAVANVAGTKVALDEVTRLAEEVPGIRRAVAEAESNAISGEIVVLRYALEQGVEPGTVKTAAEEFLRQRLPKPAWPRRWIVDEVGLGESGKRAGMREAGSRE